MLLSLVDVRHLCLVQLCVPGAGWSLVSCPAHGTPWAQGASPHPPAHSWALATPPWAPERGKQAWRAALAEGWKIAVGSIPPQGAF